MASNDIHASNPHLIPTSPPPPPPGGGVSRNNDRCITDLHIIASNVLMNIFVLVLYLNALASCCSFPNLIGYIITWYKRIHFVYKNRVYSKSELYVIMELWWLSIHAIIGIRDVIAHAHQFRKTIATALKCVHQHSARKDCLDSS